MRCAVIGAGGLGGYFGAKLAAAAHDVTFVPRGASLQALRADGVRVIEQEDLHAPRVCASDDASQVGPVDAVPLGVKTHSLPGALAALRHLVGPDTAVRTMQNGVETAQIVGEVVPPARVDRRVPRPQAPQHARGRADPTRAARQPQSANPRGELMLTA